MNVVRHNLCSGPQRKAVPKQAIQDQCLASETPQEHTCQADRDRAQNHSPVEEGGIVRFTEFDPEKVKSTGRQFWAVAGPSVEDSPKRWRLEILEPSEIDDSRHFMKKGLPFAGLKYDADVRRYGRDCDASAEADS